MDTNNIIPRPNDIIVVTYGDLSKEKYNIDKVTPDHLIISLEDDPNVVKVIIRDRWELAYLPGTIETIIKPGYTMSIESHQPELLAIGGSFHMNEILKQLDEKIQENDYVCADKILTRYQRNLLPEAIYNPESSFGEFYWYPIENKSERERFDFWNWLHYHRAMWTIEMLYYCYMSDDKTIIHDTIKWINTYNRKLNTRDPSETKELLGELIHGVFSDDNLRLFQELGTIPDFYEKTYGVNRDDKSRIFQKFLEKYPSAVNIKEYLEDKYGEKEQDNST